MHLCANSLMKDRSILVLAWATEYLSLMRFKSFVALVLVALLSPISPAEAATPKAGAKCTKAGATATAAGKKFTCIKSGTKLVWNKGVAIKVASPTPTPSNSRSADDLNGLSCTNENQVINNSFGEFKCLKINSMLQWSKNNLVRPSPNPTPIPGATTR